MSDTRFVWKYLPSLNSGMNASQVDAAIQAMNFIVSSYAAPHIADQVITLTEVLAIVKTLGILSQLRPNDAHIAFVCAKFSFGSGNTDKAFDQLQVIERCHPYYWPASCYHAATLYMLAKKDDVAWKKQEEYLHEAYALTQSVIKYDKALPLQYRPTADMIECMTELQREIKQLLLPADVSPFKTCAGITLFTPDRLKPKKLAYDCTKSDRYEILFGKKSLTPVTVLFQTARISCYKSGDVSVDPDFIKRNKFGAIGSGKS